ncbi:MAG TPA: hypothetical protein DF383_05835 [Deltaproteobacteria bacterium]|nr:hypothetical protein [Deltaproteobacteria bacterium]
MIGASSKMFRISLWFLKPFRKPYLWARKKWPDWFAERLHSGLDLDTSRMLPKFNTFHRLFFSRGFDTIAISADDIQNLTTAGQRGPVVYLMRHWGQVEYNFFNQLFLKRRFPLVAHNNMVRMGHWMPNYRIFPIIFQKLDRFFVTGEWPYNATLFDLKEALQAKKPVLYCLNLPRGLGWVEAGHEAQREIFRELLAAQSDLGPSIQLVPLHFIYDKHPGHAKASLSDILLGNLENPGYLRKMMLFLRNYKKRAVARIGEPLELRKLAAPYGAETDDATAEGIAIEVQRAFEMESRQVTGPKLQNRRRFLAKIMESAEFREQLASIAAAAEVPTAKAEKKTLGYLREIASDINFTLIQLWDYFLSWLFHSLYDGLEIDKAGLARVKKVAKNSALALVPCHKSHIDYLLLSYIFYDNDMTLPHVCAGINLNFWPMGSIFRKSGGYFIRRSLPNDPFYPLALKGYVKTLMREGYFQEFFLEGTRSRSGKLFPPKLGLLGMMVESFLEGGVEDLHFVPVALGYERVLEEGSYLQESKGGKKQREKFTDLFRLPKFLRRRYGKVYLQFAEPISLSQALAPQAPSGRTGAAERKKFVAELARSICISINEVSTLMPSALIATALLSFHAHSLSPRETLERANALFAFAKQSDTRLAGNLQKQAPAALEEALQHFIAEGLVREHEDLEGKFLKIREETRHHLDLYKNQGIHAFAPAALAQLCRDKAPSSYEKVIDLLSSEFFFAPQKDAASPIPWLSGIALPVIESYWLALSVIARDPFEKWEERKLSQRILEQGEAFKLRGSLEFSESLSRFPIQNALAKFLEMGILKNHLEDMGPSGKKIFSPGPETELRAETLHLLETLLGKARQEPAVPANLSNVYPLLSKGGTEPV